MACRIGTPTCCRNPPCPVRAPTWNCCRPWLIWAREQLFLRYLDMHPAVAPYGSAEEFLPVCGTAGLGRLLVEGKTEYWAVLRCQASDPRWRVREAVAIALQRYGRQDMPVLLAEMRQWCSGTLLEQRAVVAALCEPALLADPINAQAVLSVLDEIAIWILSRDGGGRRTRVISVCCARRSGYGWSVAAAGFCRKIGRYYLEI